MQRSSDPIDQYIKERSLRLTSEQNEIIEYTNSWPVEVGTFSGYTALTIALALPSD
ncbi:unnamed protein product, partial [Adineta steineri]